MFEPILTEKTVYMVGSGMKQDQAEMGSPSSPPAEGSVEAI